MAVKVLFVCLGNICRSPTAEGVFRARVEAAGLAQHIYADSCGTAPFHIGKNPDPRAVKAAANRDYDISQLVARQVDDHDFHGFDYIIPMDHKNLSTLKGWAPAGHDGTLELFMKFCQNNGNTQVPDPYHGGADDFELVLDLLERASDGLLDHIKSNHNISS